ncbi:MAG: tryptophan 2,3-dioxygenase family protein, partial [Chitinophagales bacterium]
MEQDPLLTEKLEKLREKYAAMGQDMLSYIDGLLYADYLTYWDYIRLDVLLNLQVPRTPYPDEKIFILYHQITELYFRLVLHAGEQVRERGDKLTSSFFTTQVKRMNSYFESLIKSFEIMIEGMDKQQFLKFRMALLPASGFQSAQYRIIELMATDAYLLTWHEKRAEFDKRTDAKRLYKNLYWKKGATELETKKKTLTLKQFEVKYGDDFIEMIDEYRKQNLYFLYRKLKRESKENLDSLKHELRKLDHYANVQWPLMHYRSAVRYLQKDPEDIKATGGTNWQKYLPPRNQFIVFYPELWTELELKEWGVKEFR